MTGHDLHTAATSRAAPTESPATTASQSTRPPSQTVARLARSLGWFSIALGLTEALFPLATGRSIGMPGKSALLRSYGAREIGAGVGLLAAEDPTPWLWGRVAGDAMDIATLAIQLVNGRSGVRSVFGRSSRRKTAFALAVVAGVTALDIAAARVAAADRHRPAPPDYGGRSGFPDGVEAMRGRAWSTGFTMPADMRVPAPLAPYPAR